MSIRFIIIFCSIFLLGIQGEPIKRSDIEDSLLKDILARAFGLKKDGSNIIKKNVVQNDEDTVKRSHFGLSHDEGREIMGRCDIHKTCESAQYCDGIYCYKCKGEGKHCSLNGQCCEGAECQFGICTAGVAAGDPGTFCDISKDCKGTDACCIIELSISSDHSICKPMLEENESCGPINLFHQNTMKAHMDPVCGPCKSGLACKGVGIYGRHSICLPEDEE